MNATIAMARAPLHLWIVGGLSLLWNAVGATDYTLTHLQGSAYIRAAGLGEDMVAWFESVPAWMTASWALGVWGGVAGSILLLLRSRHAAAAFGLSLAGVAAMTLGTSLVHPYPAGMVSPGGLAFEWTIKLVAVLLLIYALRMRRRGILR